MATKQDLWKYFPHSFAAKCSKNQFRLYSHIKHISREITPYLYNGGGRFIVTLPPRHGKSLFISQWVPSWYLTTFPDRKVILASYASEFASKWGGAVKTVLTENEIAKEMNALRYDTKSKSNFMTKAGGGMITAGVGGPMTGQGGNLIIIDDPIKNYQDASSEVIRKRQIEWFNSVVRTRLEPGGTIILLMTRWHEGDLAGHLLNPEKEDDETATEWTHINFPAIAEEEDVLGRSIGDALCPERYSEEDLSIIRNDVGGLVWEALYQQRPSAQAGNMVKGAWIRRFDAWPTRYDQKIIVADLTFKKDEQTDFCCIEAWGRVGSDIFLIDQIRARMDFPSQVESFKEMTRRHPDAFGKYVEEAANGAAVMATLKNSITGLIAVKPRTSKEARLSAVSPMYQAGNVHYPSEQIGPWVTVNINEVLNFPNAKHDDTVDTATMALDQLGAMNSVLSKLEALTRR